MELRAKKVAEEFWGGDDKAKIPIGVNILLLLINLIQFTMLVLLYYRQYQLEQGLTVPGRALYTSRQQCWGRFYRS